MDTINERIALLIRESGKTKTECAKLLKVTPQHISSLCNGKTKPSDRTISGICDVFGVRVEWLRDGVEPREALSKEDQSLEALLGQSEITDRDRSLVKVFLKLDAPARAEVIRFVEECARELSAPADQPSAVSDVASRLAELERQNQALMNLVAEQREEIDQIKREDAADALLKAKPETVRKSG